MENHQKKTNSQSLQVKPMYAHIVAFASLDRKVSDCPCVMRQLENKGADEDNHIRHGQISILSLGLLAGVSHWFTTTL